MADVPVVELEPEAPVSTEVQEEPKVELEPEEQVLADPKEEPEQPVEPEPEQPQQPEQMSRRAIKRLEKLEQLAQKIRGQQPQPQRRIAGIEYEKLIEADPDTLGELNRASQEYGQTQYQAGLEAANNVRFHTRLEIDSPRVESKYPQFDKNSPEFNPGLASAVNDFYLGMVGYDPQTDTVRNANVRYGDFVEALSELGEAMFSTKTTQTTQNIARQAANTGLRPDGSSVKPLNLNKTPQEMSVDELNAAITASMPRDNRGRFTAQK